MRLALLILLLVEGFVLMGFEILSSRYLHPYFGSGIDTWASIISTVLLAMMSGYFVGGQVADRAKTTTPLILATTIAAAYLAGVALYGKGVILWIAESFEHGALSLSLGAAVILFVPVMLLSAWSPFLVRVLLRDPKQGGRVSGLVYGIATLGNVAGALVTAFVLIPRMGVFAITLIFAAMLLALAAMMLLLRSRTRRIMVLRSGAAGCVVAILLALPVIATAGERVYPADYPEGILFDRSGDLYFTEMAVGRIRVVANGTDRTFWQSPKCGPTGIARIDGNRFAVACHMVPAIVILDHQGNEIRRLTVSDKGDALGAPNDISPDGEGGAYFSDSGEFAPGAPATGKIYRLRADLSIERVLSRLAYANGVAFDPRRNALFVAEHLGRRIVATDSAGADPRVWLDFSKVSETTELMLGFAGPDGLRVLSDGSLVVALYGTGRVAHISPCRELTIYAGFHRYVTSVGVADGKIAVASAETNAGPPFGGDVRVKAFRPATGCTQ